MDEFSLNQLGWTPVDVEGVPVRPKRAGLYGQMGQTQPPRIYTSEARAAAQSPVKKAVPVYTKDVTE